MNTSQIKYKDFITHINKRFPLSYQEKWDESGLTIFNKNIAFLDSVVVCLDITLEIIEFAHKQKSKLIISHHPIFTKNSDIELTDVNKKCLQLLKRYKINLLSLHTCVDNHPLGINHFLINMINVNKPKQIKNNNGSFFEADLLKPTHLVQLVEEIKKIYQTNITIFNNANDNVLIKKIAICSGAGFEVLKKSINSAKVKETLFVTGDIKWHDWVYIDEKRLYVLDVGHDLEKYFIPMMKGIIEHAFPNLNVFQFFPTLKLKCYSNI